MVEDYPELIKDPTSDIVIDSQSDSQEFITARANMAADYASSAYVAAAEAITTIVDQQTGVIAPPGSVSYPSLGSPELCSARKPGLYSVDVIRADFQRHLDLNFDPVNIPSLDVLSFAGVRPDINLPDIPDTTLPTFNTDAPAVVEPSLPLAPQIVLPPIPILTDVVLPNTPDLNIGEFEGTLPTTDITPPEPVFAFHEPEHLSDIADSLKGKFVEALANGGTGIDPEVEQAIYDRAKARLDLETERHYQEAEGFFAARGHILPPGALASRLIQASNQNLQATGDLNRDVLVSAAQLEQEYIKHTISNAVQYESQLLAHTNNVAQRGFETAKAMIEAAVQIYNVKVIAYQAELEKYKTQAQVYETKIRAALAHVEIYKAQIEGAKLTLDVQKMQVDIWKARVSAIQLVIDIYKAEMEGATLHMQVQKQRLDVFRAEIEAKSAIIAGETAKWNLYQAQIVGEKAKIDLYATDVDAYGKMVSAQGTVAQVDIASAGLVVENNKLKVAELQAALSKYETDSRVNITYAQAEMDIQKNQVGIYADEVRACMAYYSTQADHYRVMVGRAEAEAQLAMKGYEVQMQSADNAANIAAESIKSSAQVAGQIAAAALSSISTSTQYGYHANASLSSASNNNRSRSDSTSKSTQYLFIKNNN